MLPGHHLAILDAQHLAQWGLPGLFVIALLAGSVVPLPTEAVIAALILGGQSWPVVLAISTGGNVLGSTSLYWLGGYVARGGAGRLGKWIEHRTQKAGERFTRSQERLRRYGAPALLLTSVPMLGDIFVLASGFVGVRPLPFLIFVTLGKGLRYAVVAVSAVAAASALRG